MFDWKTKLSNLVEKIDKISDTLRIKWKQKKGYEKPLIIFPFLGFGTNRKIFLRGRVFEDKGEIITSQTDGKRRNLANLYRRFATDEVPFAVVKAKFRNVENEFTADDEGYFAVEIENFEIENLESLYHEISLELVSPIQLNGEIAQSVGQVIVPPTTARFGVISDLDDTVISTNVTNKLKMLLTVALENEHTRVPFEGVSAFYRALRKGLNDENNPIFYVSSSPWNLYPFLTEFLKIHDIPRGALFLKDFGNHTIFNSSDHATHKLESIERVLQTYPHLPFVLIGDNGESDPQIYAEIVKKYPERIRNIYIRSIRKEAEEIAKLQELIAEIKNSNVELILAEETESAAVHAVSVGLISEEELENIREKRIKDENLPKMSEIEKAS
ncbi:MAG TPA: DUF2183 domain-containing protein [Pyrinomonadaceae bacterium]|nr:DUF2183 domain-containing protein [Pyrinomonadaceae bacterium]